MASAKGRAAKQRNGGDFGPEAWMVEFGEAENDASGETNFENYLKVWLVSEMKRLEEYREDVRRVVTEGFNPQEDTGIQLGIGAGEAIQAFDEALKAAINTGRFKLHPWVLSTYAAVAIQTVRTSGLAMWLATGSGADSFVKSSLGLLVPSLGRVIESD